MGERAFCQRREGETNLLLGVSKIAIVIVMLKRQRLRVGVQNLDLTIPHEGTNDKVQNPHFWAMKNSVRNEATNDTGGSHSFAALTENLRVV